MKCSSRGHSERSEGSLNARMNHRAVLAVLLLSSGKDNNGRIAGRLFLWQTLDSDIVWELGRSFPVGTDGLREGASYEQIA